MLGYTWGWRSHYLTTQKGGGGGGGGGKSRGRENPLFFQIEGGSIPFFLKGEKKKGKKKGRGKK